jgi:hypothetical protein
MHNRFACISCKYSKTGYIEHSYRGCWECVSFVITAGWCQREAVPCGVEHGYELTDLQATMAWGASCMQVVAPGFCALSSYSSIPLLKTNSKNWYQNTKCRLFVCSGQCNYSKLSITITNMSTADENTLVVRTIKFLQRYPIKSST